MRRFTSLFWITVLAVGAVLQYTTARSETDPYTLTIENNTELNLTILVYQTGNFDPASWYHSPLVVQFDVTPVSIERRSFSVPDGDHLLIVFSPSRCGYPSQFPTLRRETQVRAHKRAQYYVLKDDDFGTSSILPQCPERLAESGECIRLREEVAELEALRQEPELLTKYGWDLSGRIEMPNSTQTVYDRIAAIEQEKEPRIRADPMAASTDPVYRNLVQEQNQLKDFYNARMDELIREKPELVRRNIANVATLILRIDEARQRWQAKGQYRYPEVTAERDRACAVR